MTELFSRAVVSSDEVVSLDGGVSSDGVVLRCLVAHRLMTAMST